MASAQEITSGKRVLVVDDERSVRDVLGDGLEMMGYEVVVASSPDEALEAVHEHPEIRLVLSDIDMPGGSGLDLLKRVKAYNPDVDVIMVTGIVDADTAINTIRDGASDYVTKPFNLQEVAIVVERTLEKRQLILENRAYQQNLEDKVHERTRELLQKKVEIEKLFGELQDSYENTLHALVTALDFRDNETQGHSSRVV
ncbi:MAG: response regulator, partial [Acidobacteriota bacterium]|nr:response regulator [Acidobacteriota bacterium]